MTAFRRLFCSLCEERIAKQIEAASTSGLLPDRNTVTVTLAIYLALLAGHNQRHELFMPDTSYLLARYSVFMNILNMISDGLGFPMDEKVIFEDDNLYIPYTAFKKAWAYMKANRIDMPPDMLTLSAKAFPKFKGKRYLLIKPIEYKRKSTKFIGMK